jgi:hypothetical protein
MVKQRSSREAEGEATENKAKGGAVRKANEKAIEKRAKKKASKRKAREENKTTEGAIETKAKEEPIEAIDTGSVVNPRTKKRSASTYERSGRAKKARKRVLSPHGDEGAESVSPSFRTTPTTKRMASHSSPGEQETIEYALNMETQVVADARGVTRKNIPWDTFRSTYLCDFSVNTQPKLTIKPVRGIGKGDWNESVFWDRLRQSLSDEIRCSGCTFMPLSVPLLTH